MKDEKRPETLIFKGTIEGVERPKIHYQRQNDEYWTDKIYCNIDDEDQNFIFSGWQVDAMPEMFEVPEPPRKYPIERETAKVIYGAYEPYPSHEGFTKWLNAHGLEITNTLPDSAEDEAGYIWTDEKVCNFIWNFVKSNIPTARVFQEIIQADLENFKSQNP